MVYSRKNHHAIIIYVILTFCLYTQQQEIDNSKPYMPYMNKLLAHIVHYKLEPSDLCDLITHIEHVLHHESTLHSLRNYTPMSNTLKALKFYDVRRILSTREQDELIALFENLEHLIVDELVWRNIQQEEQKRDSHSSHDRNSNNKSE